jgi:hypothetical protein
LLGWRSCEQTRKPAGRGAGREFKSDEGSGIRQLRACWRIAIAHLFDVIEIAAGRGRMKQSGSSNSGTEQHA